MPCMKEAYEIETVHLFVLQISLLVSIRKQNLLGEIFE